MNTSHPAFKTVIAIRGVSYWKGISLPYPEPCIRLVRQDDLASFTEQCGRSRACVATQ